MAIHYYDLFSLQWSSRNFGDDINPFLLNKLLDPSILASDDICVIGIGTILNSDNAERVSQYRRKVVFSSGTGYGEALTGLDDSWDIACVRGPNTAAVMGLPPSKAICDGAILLSDYFDPLVESKRSGIVFIPHIRTHWGVGECLRPICDDLGWRYLTPDMPAEDFIEIVRSASLVITEAMHGAILADTMRVPWIAVALHQHNDFKWRDWFLSIEEDYRCTFVLPKVWNPQKSTIGRLKYPYQKWKMTRLHRQMKGLPEDCRPSLSSEELLNRKKTQLREKLDYINRTYSA
jgi:succinoglycan biosynthesis protein ExoV